MIVRFPTPPIVYNVTWFTQFMAAMQRHFAEIVSSQQEAPKIILRAPNGTNYDVTVSDAGALVVTETVKPNA